MAIEKKSSNTKPYNPKRLNLLQLAIAVVIIVLVNIVGSFLFHRFDLTSEKRYSLSPATKDLLSNRMPLERP